jgi:hypothetical protein
LKIEWLPANEVERDLAVALETGDSRRYARILLSAPLFLPVLPEAGSELRDELERRLPLSHEHVLVFTSPAAISGVLGEFSRGWKETDMTSLARLWPDPRYQLALNPGLPIGAVLPLGALPRLADGSETLVAIDDLQERLVEETQAQIRQDCLAELGGGPGPIDVRPVNRTEVELLAAAKAQDADAFLETLINAEVVVPTTESVADPLSMAEADFPWQEVGPAIPVFSTTAMLARAAPDVAHYVEAPFLLVAANWPSEEHVLCFNPGSSTELILSGDGVDQLIAAVAEGLSESDLAE